MAKTVKKYVIFSKIIKNDATSLSVNDLASYDVVKSDALQGYYEGKTVYGCGGPLSGMTLIQMLEMADELDTPDPRDDPATFTAQLKQIAGVAYSDRYKHVADRTYYTIDEQSYISRSYILQLLEMEEDENAFEDDESMETTSFSIVDSNGLVVSCTNTLSSFWGCKTAVDGFFINNSNVNFSENGVNKYEPGKRSRTYTSPTIIVGDDGYILSVGTPGGSHIPSLLFNVISDVVKYGMDPQKAVEKPALLYQKGVLSVELDKDGNTWLDTTKIRERIVYRSSGYWWGCISLAGFDGKNAFGAYDFRRNATKAGVYNPTGNSES
ncbi:MAG: gamma-glutamyltransferase [Clostridia bacterium]|nr:gamma-glutamyltransferase [Clostridia bacterium]